MNSRRTIILVVAIAMAGLAAMGLLIYVRGIEDNVYAGRELVTVWVAEGEIPKGASGSDLEDRGLIVEKQIPTEFAPDLKINVPREEIVGLVAVNNIPANQTIVKGMFAAPAIVQTGVTDRLDERVDDEENLRRRDMTTFTFNVGQTNGVAGLLEPGDFVNIMTARPLPAEPGVETDENGDPVDPAAAPTAEADPELVRTGSVYNTDARYVYQKAEILAIDTRLPATVDSADDTEVVVTGGGLITLAVPPEVAQILYAIDEFYLTLVSPDYEPWPLPPLDLNIEDFPGESCSLLTPYGAPAPETDEDSTVCERYEEDLLAQSLITNARP